MSAVDVVILPKQYAQHLGVSGRRHEHTGTTAGLEGHHRSLPVAVSLCRERIS